MKTRYLAGVLILVATMGRAFASDDGAQPPSAREMLKARLAEETKNAPVKPGTPALAVPSLPSTASISVQKPAPAMPVDKNPLLNTTAAPTVDSSTAKPKSPEAVMPKVEVKKDRITVLDQKLAKKDQEIAREKKNTKPSELDKALNDAKIAKPLAIFGGDSTQFRQRVASERVGLMEDEKDLIEAIAHANTKEEKAELQKELDELRAERRELERALR